MAIFVSARYGEAHTMEPEKGYLHVYTGNGKGKTTAAFGLALRALCAGKRVFVAQFVKSMQYNETAVADHFDGIEIHQYGRGCFINRPAAPEDRAAAEAGWETCREVLRSDRFDVVILDELSIAFHYELLDVDRVLDDIRARNPHIEVVVTGRYAPPALVEAADLVTDMQEIKHYYTQGVLSRNGIDR